MNAQQYKNYKQKNHNMGKELNKLRHQFFASCPKGLESLLFEELKALGIETILQENGGVSFECKPYLAFEAIIYSRIASRIYMGLFEFDAKREKDIYFESKKFEWKKDFELSQTFKVNTILGHSPNGQKRSQFTNSMFLGLQLKDAIVDKFRSEFGERPDVNPEDPDYSLLLFVRPYDNPFSTKEKCSVLVDLCGDALSNRGYRTERFSAPLRENLAAAIIKLSGLTQKETFFDGMCGSGTLTTEALLQMGNIPSGFMKVLEYAKNPRSNPWKFVSMRFFTRDKFLQEKFRQIIGKAKDEYQKGVDSLHNSEQRFFANDNDQKAINISKIHLENAGLQGLVEFSKLDATELSGTEDLNGVFVVNPPYGDRLETGEEEKLKELYHNLGETLKSNFKGFRAYILTGNLEKLKEISLRTSKRHILSNGNIECRLAEYKLF